MLWSAIAIVILIAAAAFVAPRLLDLPSVKAQLERELSRAVKGEVAWDALEVRLFPFPHGVLRGARITLPDVATGGADRVELGLRLLPLLRGRVEVDALSVTRPVLRIQIGRSSPSAAAPASDPISAYRQALQPLTNAVRKFAGRMSLAIRDGQVDIHVPGLPPIGATKLNLRVDSDRAGITVTGSAVGNYWDRVQLDGRIEFADLRAKAVLEAVGVKPQTVLDRVMTDIQPAIVLPIVGLRVEASTDGHTSLDLALNASMPSTSLQLGSRRLDIAEVRLKGTGKVNAQDIEFALTDVHLGELLPAGRATLRLAGPRRQPQVAIQVAALDLGRLRVAALAIAGDQAPVRDYVARIRGGEITDVRLSASAETLPLLPRLQSLTGSLTLKDAAMLAPGVEEEIKEVSARAELVDSRLKVRDMTGRLGASRVSDGSLDYGIEDRHLTSKIGFDLDLAQLLQLTRRVLPEGQRAPLQAIESLAGRAQGSVTAALSGAQWSVDARLMRSDSVLHLRDLPWPVSLGEGRVIATRKRVAASGLAGRVGASTFTQVHADIAPGPPVQLDAAGGQASLALAELYHWLQSQPALAKPLQPLRAVAGHADVTLNSLSGRLDRPAALAYDVTMQPRRMQLEVAELPGPATIDGGSVRITQDALTLDRLGAQMLDAHVGVSGQVTHFQTKQPAVDANISEGVLGEKLIDWIWRRANLPPRLMPVTPLQLAAQRVRWSDSGLSLTASARFAAGQTVGVDLAWILHEDAPAPTRATGSRLDAPSSRDLHESSRPGLKGGAIDIRRLTLKDRESDATLSFATRGRLLDVGFSGKLASRSVAAMLKNATGEHPGRIYGDMRLTLDRDRQRRTSAQGGLAGEQLDLGTILPVPLKLERIDLEGDGGVLRVHELSVDWAEQKAVIRGEIVRKPTGPVIQAEIDSPGIVIDALLPPARKPEEAAQSKPSEEAKPAPEPTRETLRLWPPPVTGTLALRAGYLMFRGFRVEPVRADLELNSDGAAMRVTEAALCGVAFPFTVSALPGEVKVAVHMSARGQPLEGAARCFTDQRVLITGRFDLAAELAAKGKPNDLLRSIEGPLEFHAHDGEIRKFAMLGNILSLKNVSGLFKNKVDLGGEGFPYRDIVVRGRFGNGEFEAEAGSLDSDALGVAATGSIDLTAEHGTHLTVLVAPFSGLDRLVRKVPIIGYILGGVLTSVPVGVSGDIRDPLVVPLGPRAVTSELVGIFQRTIKLPGRLLEPAAGSPVR